MNYHQDKLLLCAIDMVILVVFLLPSNSFCYPCVRQYPVHWKYQKKGSVLALQGTSYP